MPHYLRTLSQPSQQLLWVVTSTAKGTATHLRLRFTISPKLRIPAGSYMPM